VAYREPQVFGFQVVFANADAVEGIGILEERNC
jgi:hypothetical protein